MGLKKAIVITPTTGALELLDAIKSVKEQFLEVDHLVVVDGKELDLTVDKVSYGGFDLHYMAMPIQDQPVLFSQTTINKSVYYIPYNNRVKVEGGGYDSAMRVRYVPAQTKYGNDMIGEIHTGALSPVNPNGDAMNWTCSWTTAQGLECLGVQHFLRQQVLS